MVWQHLLVAKCTTCGKIQQWAGKNRRTVLGKIGHDGWQVRAGELYCYLHRTEGEYEHTARMHAVRDDYETRKLARQTA